MAKALVATILLKNGQTPASFCLYSFFSNTNYTKNCRLQRDLNSDWRSRRRGRWPLDHHHGPNGGTISLFPRMVRSHASMLLYWKRNRVNEKYLLILSYVKMGSFSFIFGLFKQTIQFLQQFNVKNVHPLSGAGGFEPTTYTVVCWWLVECICLWKSVKKKRK